MLKPIRKWQQQRLSIRALPEIAKALDIQLTEALDRYRFLLTTLKVKPNRLDEEIWQKYDDLIAEIPELISRSQGRLWRRPSRLTELEADWQNLLNGQKDLLTLINRAIEAAEFYDKMESAKDDKRRQKAALKSDLKKLTKAKLSLIQAVHHIVLREKSVESLSGGSVLLNIDMAIDFWEEAIREISALEAQPDTDIQELVKHIYFVRDLIVEAPSKADKVKQVEREMNELLELDEQIQRATQKSILYHEELNRNLTKLRRGVAEHWARANWQSLESTLQEAREYAQRNINHLQSELYVIRKRSGFRQPETDGASQLPAGNRPIALSRALAKYTEANANTIYIDPDADSSIRYLYQDGSA